MYQFTKPSPTTLRRNKSNEGEFIENKIRRLVQNREPITDGAPLVYQETEEGKPKAEFDIRTDRWELATAAMDKVHRTKAKTDGTGPTQPKEGEGKEPGQPGEGPGVEE